MKLGLCQIIALGSFGVCRYHTVSATVQASSSIMRPHRGASQFLIPGNPHMELYRIRLAAAMIVSEFNKVNDGPKLPFFF